MAKKPTKAEGILVGCDFTIDRVDNFVFNVKFKSVSTNEPGVKPLVSYSIYSSWQYAGFKEPFTRFAGVDVLKNHIEIYSYTFGVRLSTKVPFSQITFL